MLGCDPNLLGKQVVLPLAREAAGGGGSVLLTRHRRIAEEAVSIMEEEFGEDVAGRLEELARAAISARLDGVYVPELHNWDYILPDRFVHKAPETAIRIARALLDTSPDDASLAVNLARIYRGCNDPAAGTEVLERFTGEVRVREHRTFWSEWGTCAGNAGDQALSAVLYGWSLADQAAPGPPDNKRAKLSLAGLGIALGELHERFRDCCFIAGRGAVAHLGLRLDLDAKTRGYFERHRRAAEKGEAHTANPAEALEQLRAALIAAWEVCGRQADLADRISPPAAMSFSGLAR